MSTSRASLLAALALTAASIAPAALAQVVQRGPIFNPATGSRYYALEANYVAARAWAQQRIQGDLATISSAAENTFITTNFTAAPLNHAVEIGLNDIATEGTFVWADGSTSTYRNWSGGTPEAAGNGDNADIVRVTPTGVWQVRPDSSGPLALVETSAPLRVPGEFATVQAALNFADPIGGAVIEIAPGVHDLSAGLNIFGNVILRATAPGVELRSATAGTSLTVHGSLRVEGMALTMRSGSAPMFEVMNSAHLSFTDLTISSLNGPTSGPVVLSAGALNVERSTVRSAGALVAYSTVFDESSILTVSNSVLRDLGSVVFLNGANGRSAAFVNCTLVNVGSANTFVFGGAWPGTTLANSVVVNPGPRFYHSLLRVTHCLVPAPVPGENNGGGNVVGVPLFVNAAAGDFRLLPTSPGIDAASTSALLASGATDFIDLAGLPRAQDFASVPNTGQGSLAIDMGAFELPALPPPPPCVPDLNNDGELTFDDIQAFINAFNAGC